MNKTIKNNILSRIVNSFFLLALFSVLNACGGGGGGAPAPTATISGVSVTEGDTGTTDLVFTVSLSAAAGSNATVSYATADGTAVAGQDYTEASGTLTVPSGATSATITVSINTDTNYEADETFTLTLSGPSGLTLGTPGVATGTITNDDDPEGYFTGTATVNTSTSINDLIGLVYGGRLMLFSATGTPNVLYDIDPGTITGSSYSGTVHVYEDGVENGQSVTVTGSTGNGQITGTFSGTGFAAGTFTVEYDANSNSGATLAKIETNIGSEWGGFSYGIDVDNSYFRNSTSDVYAGGDLSGERCIYGGNLVIPDTNTNIYELAHDIETQIPIVGTCTTPYESAGHTGFAAVVNGTLPDDTLVYGFTNGAIALYAVMTR